MTSSESLETALNAGASDYIRKPVDSIELLARTKANLHLSEKYQEIKKLNYAKDTIFSIISHDVRGPIGTIKSFIDILLTNNSELDKTKLLEYLTLINHQSSSVYDTINNLLEWSNNQKDNIHYEPMHQCVNVAVENNIELLTGIAHQKKVNISNKIPSNAFAFFDSDLISTVIRNLISNAIKFTPKNGTVTINAEITDKIVTVSVSDTGVGIHPERIHSIFDKSTYESTYGTDSEKGSGLGLKICQDFIEKHNEKIWVESHIDKGSIFKFTLPSSINLLMNN